MKFRPSFRRSEDNWSWNKLAQERGLRDGKSEKPTLDWGPDSVPFLIELSKRAIEQAKVLQSATRVVLGDAIRESALRDDKISSLKTQISFQNVKSEGAIARTNKIQEHIDGYTEENPVGRFARLRAVPDLLYWPVLLLLASGEILITAPALILLFNDTEVFAWTIAFAVGLLTIAYAHIVGISLKMKLDRHRPQETWVVKLLWPFSAVVFLAVLFLATLRSGQTLDKLASFNLITGEVGRKLFLWGFFISLQLAFIGTAAMLAFLHHSQLEHDLTRSKRAIKRLEKKRKKLLMKYTQLASHSFLSENTIKVSRNELIAKIEVIGSHYATAAAEYCDANINARRDAIDAAHISMIPPKFDFVVDTFDDLIILSIEYSAASQSESKE